MASATWRQPVRRSALEDVHTRLGAEWIADDARWPRSYGDDATEQAAAAERAGLAEIGPIDILVIRGPHTAAALGTLGITSAPRSVVAANDDIEAWCLGDDEAMLLQAGSADPAGADTLAAKLRETGAAVTDQSSGISILRLVGPAAPAILAEVCAVDLSPAALAVGDVVQVPMAGIRVSLSRRDHGDMPGYTLLVMRDQTEYVWNSLMTIGRPHGLEPIGAIEASAS